jgi:catechol 2,3-dioxygenase-like lactoylglutathione lyase family enzyme
MLHYRGSGFSVHHYAIREEDGAMLTELMEVILYVKNMQAQVVYYRDKLGLRVKEPQQVEDYSAVFWVELDTGACTLVLHGGGQQRIGDDAPKVVFRVSQIEQARRTLVERGVLLGEIRSPAPGVLVCDGVDPEGNKFSIESR